jgi:hypothetical protein
MPAFGRFACWALIFGACQLPCSAEGAPAQSRLSVKIEWSGTDKPTGVEFQDDNGLDSFADKVTYYLGERTSDALYSVNMFVVRYGDIAMPFYARSQTAAPTFTFLVTKLPSSLSCNNTDVSRIVNRVPSHDLNDRIALMQTARAMLSSDNCASFNRRSLAKIYFQVSCNLAKDTPFFALSEDAVDRYRAETNDAESTEMQITACRDQIRGSALKPAFEEAQKAKRADYDQFQSINDNLMKLADDPDWQGAFRAIQVKRGDLEHMQVEALVAETNDATRTIEQRSAAANKLDALKDVTKYSGFKRAGVPDTIGQDQLVKIGQGF